MVEDYEQELTSNPGAGQAFTATAFGGLPYALGTASGAIPIDIAAGEPLQAMMQCTQNFDALTSAVFDVLACDDAAGTNPVTLATSGAITLANLTTANTPTKRLGGIIPAGLITTAKKFILAKYTLTGTQPTVGKMRIWLQKSVDVLPVNKGAL